jgi:hypothetical protein
VSAETKEQSKQWLHMHSPNKLKKFKQTACQKADGNCFLGQKRSADGKFMQQETTIMSEVYCEMLKKLHSTIQNKRHRLLMSSIVFLHDSVHLHTAAHSQVLLENFYWELFDRPPNSPDLALSDYHLFTYLKNWLGSQCFDNNE